MKEPRVPESPLENEHFNFQLKNSNSEANDDSLLVDSSSSLSPEHLKAQNIPHSPNNSSLHLSRAQLSIAIRHTRQSARQRLIRTISKIVVHTDRITIIRAVERLVTAHKDVGLDEDLCTIACVDAVVDSREVRVENVACAEADGGRARVDVEPVVVVLCDAEMAGVFVAVGVGMTDQRCFPVIVNVAIRDGNVVGGVGELGKCESRGHIQTAKDLRR